MPKLAANVSTQFTDRPFLERFEAARRAGFTAVECQFPYEAEARAIRARLDEHGLELVLFNTPPGDFAAGERGLCGLPGREDDFKAAMEKTLAYADVLGTRNLHVMCGVQPNDCELDQCLEVFRRNLEVGCELARSAGRLCLLEPINTRDIPGYMLNTPAEAAALIGELGRDNLKLQFDFYHTQIMAGDLARNFERHLPIIAHVQVAGVPERQEPDVGEVNYTYLFELVDRLGYAGWVGCEYFPKGRTEDGLGWAMRYGVSPEVTQLATGGLRV